MAIPTLDIWNKLPQVIKDEHGPRIAAYMPNTETKDDPDWDGEGEAPQVPKYTDKQWFDQIAIRHYKACSRKGQVMLNMQDNAVINPIE